MRGSITRILSFGFLLQLFFTSVSYGFTGTEGAAFLELPIGARPASMGSAYSMLAEDAYAPVWNPAGLAFLEDAQLAGMHSVYLQSTSYDYGSFVHPLGAGRGIGVAVQDFQPGSIAALDASGNPIGSFNGSFANYMLSFGQAINNTLGIGLTGQFINEQIAGVSGHAYAGTGGLLYRPNARWRFAAVVANAGQKLTLLSTGDSLPLVYRVGGAYHPIPSWTFALEGAQQQSGLTSFHAGADYETPFGFSCRMGYNTERIRELSPVAGISVGMSMLIWKQDFSYAWLPMSDLGSSHLFSVVIHFGQPKKLEENPNRLQRPPPDNDQDFTLENL